MKRWWLVLLVMSMAGCGDDGTSPRSGVPVISNLVFSPDFLYVTDFSPTGAVITGSFDFQDPDGDLAELHLTTSAGADLSLPLADATGLTQGTLLGELTLPPSPVGDYEFRVWVEDARGNDSNVLSDIFSVRVDDSATGWTQRAVGGMGQLNSVARSDAGFCAVGYGGAVLQSADGQVWVPVSSGSTQDLFDVVWSGSQFVAVGDMGTVLTSPGGLAWTDRSVPQPVTTLYGVAWSGTDFVAVGMVGGMEPSQVLASPDGVDWTASPLLVGVSELRAVTWTGSRFVALGTCSDDSTCVAASLDGLSWSVVKKLEPTYPRDLIWTGTRLVGVGGTGKVLVSSDGTSWDVVQTDSSALFGVAWSGDRLAAAGVGVCTSSDGQAWQQVSTEQTLRSLIWAEIRYVAVGFNGLAMTSP